MKLPITVNIAVVGESRSAGKTTFMIRSLDILRDFDNGMREPNYRFNDIQFAMPDADKTKQPVRQDGEPVASENKYVSFNELVKRLYYHRKFPETTALSDVYTFDAQLITKDQGGVENYLDLVRFNWIDWPGTTTMLGADDASNLRRTDFRESLRDVDAVIFFRSAAELIPESVYSTRNGSDRRIDPTPEERKRSDDITNSFKIVAEMVKGNRNIPSGQGAWPVPLCMVVTQSEKRDDAYDELKRRAKDAVKIWKTDSVKRNTWQARRLKTMFFITTAVRTMPPHDSPPSAGPLSCESTVEPILWLTAQTLRMYRNTLDDLVWTDASKRTIENSALRLEEWARQNLIKGRLHDVESLQAVVVPPSSIKSVWPSLGSEKS